MDEIVKDFLIESGENLDRLDQELVKLESAPSSKELLASIFRTIHTIKGSCGFLGFARLEKVAHSGESLLSKLRDGELGLNEEITSGLLAMVDAVRNMLAKIEQTEQDGEEEYAALIAHLKELQDKQVAKPQSAIPAQVAEESKSSEAVPIADSAAQAPDASTTGGVSVEQGCKRSEVPAKALHVQEIGQHQAGEILMEQGPAKTDEGKAAQEAVQSRNPDSLAETIRVGVNLLDRLMNLVGELVLARNQLLQFSNSTQDAGFQTVSQRMNLIATELQEEVMKTRMQPIGNVWNKFPRTVRDLALNCGKDVRLEMEGQNTELDRTIIEAIKDPLTHLVRNCVDHGIERPETREQAGKPSAGLVKLRAFHEGGQVNIEITDDGAGLNSERILQKAVERGLLSAQQAGRMVDRDIFNMIFLPGFSTAEKVTNVSGRGVGMDVVRTNVEKIGGTVDVQSIAGKGTTVRMKIPLTLAIIPALIVTTSGDRYAVPQVNLLELVRLEGEQVRTAIEQVNGAPVYRLRGRLLPLMYLRRELNVEYPAVHCSSTATGAESVQEAHSVNIVVLRADERQFGLVVDDINDTEEIVVKPLGKQLKSVNAFAGATIMGDGKVALILDVLGLAQRANLVSGIRDQARAEKAVAAAAEQEGAGHSSYLLFQHGDKGRLAVDLSLVARLEEFPLNQVEIAADQEVVQYRGQIMPLIRVSERLGTANQGTPADSQEPLHVVVYSEKGRSVGLVVDHILDIVEEPFVMQRQTSRKGILGSAVIQKRTTDILDIPGLVAAAELKQLVDTVQG